MLGERMPARAVEPDKGGRGVPFCAGALPIPYHRLKPSAISRRRRQPWVLLLMCSSPWGLLCSGPQTAHVFARVTQHCAMHTDAD